jgi:hypothetical protein
LDVGWAAAAVTRVQSLGVVKVQMDVVVSNMATLDIIS